jgi:osmotically-inducible protein OsmY
MRKALNSGVVILGLAMAVGIAACAQTPTHESTGAYVDDSAVTAKVKTAILQDPALKVFEIHVVTYKGVVQLSGFVDSQRMIEHATTVAAGVEGVRSVQNQLAIKP